MTLSEKLLYSRKVLGLVLFLVYLAITYVIVEFNYNGIAIGTAAILILFGYLAYYVHLHRSSKEVLALTTFTAVSLVLGLVTGLVIIEFSNIGAVMYSLTLSASLVLLLISLGKLYKI